MEDDINSMIKCTAKSKAVGESKAEKYLYKLNLWNRVIQEQEGLIT